MSGETGKSVAAAVWPWREEPERRERERARLARERRRSGLVQGIVGGIAAFLLTRYVSPVAGTVVAVIAGTLLLLALASPLGAYGKVTSWIGRFAHGVGLAVTWLLLPVLFVLVFWPLGLALRARGRLRLRTSPDRTAGSYWGSAGTWPKPADDYRRQF
jgi:hypothetical protein